MVRVVGSGESGSEDGAEGDAATDADDVGVEERAGGVDEAHDDEQPSSEVAEDGAPPDSDGVVGSGESGSWDGAEGDAATDADDVGVEERAGGVDEAYDDEQPCAEVAEDGATASNGDVGNSESEIEDEIHNELEDASNGTTGRWSGAYARWRHRLRRR